ncbi:glutathione S-transferase omega-1-like isoform X1 [Mizuhopecten yessoensis]|uniref:Glutathione S-transferase omega n=1 Tax=Mizuhopecten yessoensis TaxID=6573 RepID=A0A210QYN8_MIZYE|nr:glutathione S-transferase omega-1-like isoform X1 [Mizuhopecten yessoensis]OWF53844.1 Glutathione S-transferase omega-1 [Mizuhopecten yessoensis]
MSKSGRLMTRLVQLRLATYVRSRNLSCEIPAMSLKHLGKESTCPPLTAGRLRLYSMKFCPYAQRTRLVLEYKNIPYETVNINLKSKPDWFRDRYINALVPVLEKDGTVIYESSVCNEYLDEVYPEPQLIPTNPVLKAKDKMLSEQFGKVTSLFYDIPKSKGDNSYNKNVRMFHYQMQFYDRELSKRGLYFGGSAPCNVDFMIWPWFERLGVMTVVSPESAITADKYPNLAPWQERMYTLPCVKDTFVKPDDHIHFFMTLRQGTPDYDYGS